MSSEKEKNTSGKGMAKRVFALLGVVILVMMYVMTLVFAIIDNPATMNMFKASIALTVFVPIMLYGYQLVYRVLKGTAAGNNPETENNKDSSSNAE